MTRTNATISDCQKLLLQLLSLVDEICRAQGITYWLDGGTLLGARRNGSFIPWDDDIDICVPYLDCERLVDLLQQECERDQSLFLYSNYRGNSFWSTYFGSIEILKHGIFPVQIDIIPVKAVENTAQDISFDKSIEQLVSYYQLGSVSRPNSVFQEHRDLMDAFRYRLARENAFRAFHKYLRKNSVIQKDKLINYVFGDCIVAKKRAYYRFDTIFPLLEIEFEGKRFFRPNDVDGYLASLYGDNFIKPPSDAKQKPSSDRYYFNTLPRTVVGKRVASAYQLLGVNIQLKLILKNNLLSRMAFSQYSLSVIVRYMLNRQWSDVGIFIRYFIFK